MALQRLADSIASSRATPVAPAPVAPAPVAPAPDILAAAIEGLMRIAAGLKDAHPGAAAVVAAAAARIRRG